MLRPPPTPTLFPYTTLFRSITMTVPGALEVIRELAKNNASDVLVGAGTVLNAEDIGSVVRSEEHTSELQSRFDLVCRLLLEKKNGSETLPVIVFCELQSNPD